jgi:hypothetical protein
VEDEDEDEELRLEDELLEGSGRARLGSGSRGSIEGGLRRGGEAKGEQRSEISARLFLGKNAGRAARREGGRCAGL